MCVGIPSLYAFDKTCSHSSSFILQRKTGGLVIWRSGTSVSLYRGVSYEVPSEEAKRRAFQTKGPQPDVRLLSDQNRRKASKDDSHAHSNHGRENFHETSTKKEGSEQEEIKLSLIHI